MRIAYFGDGRWARSALPLIATAAGVQVAVVVPRYHNPDRELMQQAEGLGIPTRHLRDVNSAEALAALRPFGVDLHVSMSFDQIFRAPFLDAAATINCHAGALPFYRGRNVLNWALINGERTFGVTVHHVDTGIDTGDIILQQHIPISATDDYASVLTKAEGACATLLHEAVLHIAAGTAKRTPQASIHPVGFYCPRRRDGDEWIDWQWPSERVVNFVRGIAPPAPGARAMVGDQVVAILQAEAIPGAPAYLATPGEVVGRQHGSIVVKTGTSSIRVTQMAAVEGGVVGPGSTPALAIGKRLVAKTQDAPVSRIA